jgi:hypothetical protein
MARWAVPFTLSHCFSVNSQPVNGPGGLSCHPPGDPGSPAVKNALRVPFAYHSGLFGPGESRRPWRPRPVATSLSLLRPFVNAPAFFKPGYKTLASVGLLKCAQHTPFLSVRTEGQSDDILRPKNRRSVHGCQGHPDRDVGVRVCGTRMCRHARPVRRTGKAEDKIAGSNFEQRRRRWPRRGEAQGRAE